MQNSREFAFFSQAYIDKLKASAKESFQAYQPRVGDRVVVQYETLSGMEGQVHEVDVVAKNAIIHIKMRSQEVVAVVPFTNIELKNDSFMDMGGLLEAMAAP
jgi:transcription antitermination factor NusG